LQQNHALRPMQASEMIAMRFEECMPLFAARKWQKRAWKFASHTCANSGTIWKCLYWFRNGSHTIAIRPMSETQKANRSSCVERRRATANLDPAGILSCLKIRIVRMGGVHGIDKGVPIIDIVSSLKG